MRVGIIGGTGREGRGLALRWARAGHAIAIGSRDPERARERAREVVEATGGQAEGGTNEWATIRSEVVVVSVPYAAHDETLRALAPHATGRVVIDITVPLRPPGVTRVQLPAGSAAALESQAILGPNTPVVATLHHVGSAHLGDTANPLDAHVLFCTDDARARAVAATLLTDLGARPIDAGSLQNAIALESLTPVLLHINKAYKIGGAGIRISGLP